MTTEKLASHREGTGTLDALDLSTAARSFANVHSEWTGDFVEIATIKEGVRQPIDESKRRLVARCFQGLVKQHTLSVRH